MTTHRTTKLFSPTLLSGAVLLALAGAGAADDRNLFQATGAEPYVFTLLDTSGSMHEEPATGNQALGSGDAPTSKLYQAKSALWDVIQDLEDDVLFGWAHFNQEDLAIGFKHWLYTRPGAGEPGAVSDPPWYSAIPFPEVGHPIWFGPNAQNAAVLATTELGSCAVPLSDAFGGVNSLGEQIDQLETFPKFGTDGDTITKVYLEPPGTSKTLEFVFTLDADSTLGDSTIEVDVTVREVDSDCSTTGGTSAQTHTFNLVPYYTQDNEGRPFLDGDATDPQLAFDFLNWTNTNVTNSGGSRLVQQDNFSARRSMLALSVSDVCDATSKWDPNDNDATGSGTITPLSYPTREDPIADRCTANP